MNDYLFPTIMIEDISLPPIGGVLFPTPSYCISKADRKKCIKHYEEIKNKEGIHVCPYGFSSVVHNKESLINISTGLRIEGAYDKKKLKERIKDDLIPVIEISEYDRFIKVGNRYAEINSKLIKAEGEIKELTEFMNVTFHEIRKLNLDIKSQAEELNQIIDRSSNESNAPFLKYRTQNVYGSSSLVSIRLDSYDLFSNPEGVTATKPVSIPVYRKFEKVKHCLDNKCKLKKVRILFEGNSYKEIHGYEIFELVPYVIFENAIKYSPQNQDIKIEFDESITPSIISVTNVGPQVSESELPRLLEKGKRGSIVIGKFPGSGIGLNFAKMVCDIHNVSIKVFSERQVLFTLDEVPYSIFKIELSLP